MSEIVGQGEIACERVGERVVEIEHLQELITLDDVQVTVGQSPNVRCRLADRHVLAELIAERISFACARRQRLHFILAYVTRYCNDHQARAVEVAF